MLAGLTSKLSGIGKIAGGTGGVALDIAGAIGQKMASHTTVSGMALGGIGGGIMSSGSLTGIGVGALMGGLGGRAGWTDYQLKGGNNLHRRLSAKLGKRITSLAPDTAKKWARERHKVSFFQSRRSKGVLVETRKLSGMQRNLGGKRMGAMAVGGGMMLGAGGLAGGLVSGLGNSLGGSSASYGRGQQASYGSSFSGMGNGTVTGY